MGKPTVEVVTDVARSGRGGLSTLAYVGVGLVMAVAVLFGQPLLFATQQVLPLDSSRRTHMDFHLPAGIIRTRDTRTCTSTCTKCDAVEQT